MHKRLIINADDFGLCPAQSYGIVEAFEHGVVSSTTAMVNSPAIEHAAWLAKRFPDLPIGLHFVLSWGKPLSPLSCLVDARASWTRASGKKTSRVCWSQGKSWKS